MNVSGGASHWSLGRQRLRSDLRRQKWHAFQFLIFEDTDPICGATGLPKIASRRQTLRSRRLTQY